MKIESFEHGCKICKYDSKKLPIVAHLPKKHQKAQIAAYKLFVISEASWKGDKKTINWDDINQKKYEPYFYMKKDASNPTGFRFRDSYCAWTVTHSAGGSRLCYPSYEDGQYHGKQHIKLYRDLMVKK